MTAKISFSNNALTASRLLGVQRRGCQPPDPGRGKRRLQILQKAPVLILHHLMHAATDRAELLVGRHAGRIPLARIPVGQHLQAAHADHEELVQVRAGNGQELQPFERRDLAVQRFVQHALVELQPTQFAIDVHRRGLRHPWTPREIETAGACTTNPPHRLLRSFRISNR